MLWNATYSGVELEVFPPGKQIIQGVKLWTVAHLLSDLYYVL